MIRIIEPGRIAIEVQMQPPERHRLERNITVYAADPSTAAALYLATNQAVRSTIQDTAAELGLSDPAHVQRANFGQHPPTEIAHQVTDVRLRN